MVSKPVDLDFVDFCQLKNVFGGGGRISNFSCDIITIQTTQPPPYYDPQESEVDQGYGYPSDLGQGTQQHWFNL